jgi:rod shape-determining protein MreD
MKIWVIAAIMLANIILQSTLLPFLQIVGIQPDTLLILVTCFALLAGSTTGMLSGLFGGLLQDILYGKSIGVNALQYMVIGYLIGLLYEKIYIDRIFVPLFFVFCGSMLRGLMMLVALYFTRAEVPFHYGFALVILPEAFYTAAVMPLMFFLMSLLYKQRFMSKRWHFRRK